MPLLDMTTDIKSFNYKKVGTKQGEYFGEDTATGFTPNRNTKDESEFINKNSIFAPNSVNFFKDKNAKGFTSKRREKNPTEYIIGSGNDFNFKNKKNSVDFFDNKMVGEGFVIEKNKQLKQSDFYGANTPGYINFNSMQLPKIHIGVDYITNINATGFTTKRTTKDLGPGLGSDGFINVPNGGTAGEFIIGSGNLYNFKGRKHSTDFVKNYGNGVNYSVDNKFTIEINSKYKEDSEYSDYPLSEITGGTLDLNYSNTNLNVLKKANLVKNDTSISRFPNRVQSIHLGDNHKYSNIPVLTGMKQRYDTLEKTDITGVKYQYTKFGGNRGLRAGHSDNPGNANIAGLNLFNGQPFIIKEILDENNKNFGKYDDSIKYDEGIARGGVLLNGVRVGEDIVRLGSWATSTPGILFGLKQVVLHKGLPLFDVPGNARKETRNFNPLGIFGSAVPTVHMPRHADSLGQLLTPSEPGKYNDADNPPDSGYHYDPGTETSLGYNKTLNPVFLSDVSSPQMRVREFNSAEKLDGGTNIKAAGAFGLGSGKVRTNNGKLYSVGVSNTLQVPYGGKFGKLNQNAKGETDPFPKDFIKFKIRDAVNGKWIIFPAHLGTIADNVTPEWTTERYIGRPDHVHIYTGAARSVNFDFKVAAFSKQEIPIIQQKMNALVGLGYPTYKKSFTTDDEFRPVAPYIYLTIGDLFNNAPGYFSSIALTFEENSTWELDDGLQIPHFFNVSITFTHIGKFLPTTISKHYDFPNLQQHELEYGVFKGNPRTNQLAPELGDVSLLYKAGDYVKGMVTEEVKNQGNSWIKETSANITDTLAVGTNTAKDTLKRTLGFD